MTAAGSFMGWLNEYGVALGLIVAIISFAVNWYYNHKEDKRRTKEHRRWMEVNENKPQRRAKD